MKSFYTQKFEPAVYDDWDDGLAVKDAASDSGGSGSGVTTASASQGGDSTTASSSSSCAVVSVWCSAAGGRAIPKDDGSSAGGARMYPQAERRQEQEVELPRSLNSLAEAPSGKVRVATAAALAPLVATQAAALVHARKPLEPLGERDSCTPLQHWEAFLQRAATETGTLSLAALNAVVCAASVRQPAGELEAAAAERHFEAEVLQPAIEKLRDCAANHADALLAVRDFGAFTDRILEALGFDADDVHAEVQEAACSDISRHRALQRLRAPEESDDGIVWMLYDLSGYAGEQEAWHMCSDGETFGCAVGAAACADGEPPSQLLQPLWEDHAASNGARRALSALVRRVFQKFPSGEAEGVRIEGVVVLYSASPPDVASICSTCQYARLFPHVRLSVAHGRSEELHLKRIGSTGWEVSWGNWTPSPVAAFA